MLIENVIFENEGVDIEMECYDIFEFKYRFLKRRRGRFGYRG